MFYRNMSRRNRIKTTSIAKDFAYIFFCSLIVAGLLDKAVPQSVKVILTDNRLISPISRLQVHAQEATPTPEPVKVAENWDDFIKSAMKIAPIYNYPVKVLLAQAALESARGTSHYATTRNNYFGMNAVDWNPDLAYTYENQEQAIIDYILTIRSNFPDAWAVRDNPEEMIVRIKAGNYATDPDYIAKVMNMNEWRLY